MTLIEVALIVSLMVAGGSEAAALARDTVFAAVMIILNGIVGLCLLVGGLKYREQAFSMDGVSAALVALATIAIMTLVFPNFTLTTPGPYYSSSQLMLIAIISLVVYGAFVFTPDRGAPAIFLDGDAPDHGESPSNAVAAAAAVLLLLCLVAVVLLAKKLAPHLESAVTKAGAPEALVGVVIAAIVLLPEGLAAVRAARQNRLQTSLNLALGSALASIGLTIPAVSVVSLAIDSRLALGIDAKSMILLMMSPVRDGAGAAYRPDHHSAWHRLARHIRRLPLHHSGPLMQPIRALLAARAFIAHHASIAHRALIPHRASIPHRALIPHRASIAVLALLLASAHAQADSQKLRIITWADYVPADLIAAFKKETGIDVEVTLSNNEEMISKLRATGGAGYDLAQPSQDRIAAAQREFGIYKPIDLSKVKTDEFQPALLGIVKRNATVDGQLYGLPYLWGTDGLVVNTKRAKVTDYPDLCNPDLKGETAIRLRRPVLMAFAFAAGKDPFALYANPTAYAALMDQVGATLIACKPNFNSSTTTRISC